jgi:hypothetical protein
VEEHFGVMRIKVFRDGDGDGDEIGASGGMRGEICFRLVGMFARYGTISNDLLPILAMKLCCC